MKEKLKYQIAEYEIIYLDCADVVTVSNQNGDVGNNGKNLDGDAWE